MWSKRPGWCARPCASTCSRDGGLDGSAEPVDRYRALVILAELEVFHSRPIAPTRRVALGVPVLPTAPPPGFGGLLLGGIVAAFIGRVDADLHGDLVRLTH